MPTGRPRIETDVSHLIQRRDDIPMSNHVSEVEVRPGEQMRLSLGIYDAKDEPKEFNVVVSPESEDGDVIRQIARLDLQKGEYELILYIASYSSRMTSVEIWQE